MKFVSEPTPPPRASKARPSSIKKPPEAEILSALGQLAEEEEIEEAELDEFYLRQPSGTILGPCDLEHVIGYAARGDIKPDWQVSRDSCNWKPATEDDELLQIMDLAALDEASLDESDVEDPYAVADSRVEPIPSIQIHTPYRVPPAKSRSSQASVADRLRASTAAGWVVVCLVGLSLLSCLFAVVVAHFDSSLSSTRQVESGTNAWVMAKEFVEDKLKSPSSANFGGTFGNHQDPKDVVTTLGRDRFRVRAWVDSQNALGATERTYFVCELQHDGDGSWRCTSLAFLE